MYYLISLKSFFFLVQKMIGSVVQQTECQLNNVHVRNTKVARNSEGGWSLVWGLPPGGPCLQVSSGSPQQLCASTRRTLFWLLSRSSTCYIVHCVTIVPCGTWLTKQMWKTTANTHLLQKTISDVSETLTWMWAKKTKYLLCRKIHISPKHS